MEILVLATDYSRPDGYVSSQYIHSRNKIYVQKGIDVSVISFAAKENYVFEGVKVFTLDTYKSLLINNNYSLLISHAPNIKHHYHFIKKFNTKFDKIVFFFHGHEVLKYSKIYPKPYDFNKKSTFGSALIRDIYDTFKLKVWKNIFTKISYKSEFVFVSNWMYDMFVNFTKIDHRVLDNKKHIIYNCVGDIFEKTNYTPQSKKEYDFITIRNLLDESKYSIDLITAIAKNNPKYTFCVIGKGEYYNKRSKPKNLIWIDTHLNHEDVTTFLNKSKVALMPTRADAQGVMACEMATFGIPLITSNIDVCKEVFQDFSNVEYLENDDFEVNIEPIYNKLLTNYNKAYSKSDKYFTKTTIETEVRLFKALVGG
ncbi:glycosyltransferase [Exiguobacterium sp. NPDC077395]|uniref:glycosyltransferase n=1 Tax=Exiguobacterium sp. NPDC077395 TaxID=3390563 RepID=UPI003D066094